MSFHLYKIKISVEIQQCLFILNCCHIFLLSPLKCFEIGTEASNKIKTMFPFVIMPNVKSHLFNYQVYKLYAAAET